MILFVKDLVGNEVLKSLNFLMFYIGLSPSLSCFWVYAMLPNFNSDFGWIMFSVYLPKRQIETIEVNVKVDQKC